MPSPELTRLTRHQYNTALIEKSREYVNNLGYKDRIILKRIVADKQAPERFGDYGKKVYKKFNAYMRTQAYKHIPETPRSIDIPRDASELSELFIAEERMTIASYHQMLKEQLHISDYLARAAPMSSNERQLAYNNFCKAVIQGVKLPLPEQQDKYLTAEVALWTSIEQSMDKTRIRFYFTSYDHAQYFKGCGMSCSFDILPALKDGDSYHIYATNA